RFKKLTEGKYVIMGKKTFQSLPGGPLKNRTNIVISDNVREEFEGCVMAYSIEETLEKAHPIDENFIIGGGMVYTQFLPYTNKLYLTRVHKEFEADIYFPEIDFSGWELIDRKEVSDDKQNEFFYTYETYERKKA
ncbi:dihydrofolate reductase, partial [Bacteroidota bacterium]